MYRHDAIARGSSVRTDELRTLIFDLDGTVADTLPVVVESFRLTLADLGRSVLSRDEVLDRFGPSEEGIIESLFGASSAKASAVFYATYIRLLGDVAAPFPGIRELLVAGRAAGLRMAMVTGKGSRGTAITIDALGLNGLFEVVRTGSPDGVVKAAAMADLVGVWGENSRNVAYVGDQPLDVVEARKAGVIAISAGWAPEADLVELMRADPDHLFETVAGLRTWLNVDTRGNGRGPDG